MSITPRLTSNLHSVLFVESREPLKFLNADEDALAIVAGHLGSVMALFERDFAVDPPRAATPKPLEGGFGWNSGEWGLACHSIEAVEIVLADGRLVTAATENPALFWALRGGGPGVSVPFPNVGRRYPLVLASPGARV